MPIIAAIAVLEILIIVHELGHFLAARTQGIRVSRFSIGFGPVLWKYQGAQTEYALRAIPLGGYVAFPDDEPIQETTPNDPGLLSNRPILDRAIVISAGVIANLVFAYLLLVVQVGSAGIPQVDYRAGVLIPQVATQVSTAAVDAGIQAGDLVTAVNGTDLAAGEAGVKTLRQAIENNPNQPLTLTLERDAQTLTVQVIPQVGEEGMPKIGVGLIPNVEISHRRPQNFGEILSTGASEFERLTKLTVQGFGQLIGNFREAAGQVSGPVAIVAIGADIARSDASRLLQFGALISINLAIINILPLPALDGGQLALLLVEGLRGKPLPSEVQYGVMQTGLFLLLGLGMVLIVRDTANLEWVQRLLQ
ncbi:RIP metalloprotease RseP [Synechococcales cyanobacterium C]|uniref:Zinc metalloprotease n=1 Tax=Petrachloros mirabilis ULC683 TaxID=2781853 RepID=A0A8K2A8X4_9CYAN|nr:RIP metalloprotease RseP [Petrachloros mirabilis]NCJ08509.1 RIP metalloprotease RseP [Petrachloros mirabilis ULC683]